MRPNISAIFFSSKRGNRRVRIFQVLPHDFQFRGVAAEVLEAEHQEAVKAVDDLVRREKDPFTVSSNYLGEGSNQMR